jgi:hypothetical protein
MNANQQEALRQRISPEDQSLSKSLGDLLLEKVKQDDPNRQTQQVLGIIKEVLANNKAPDNGAQMKEFLQIIREMAAASKANDANQPSWKDILVMQNENHKALMAFIMESKKEPPADPQLDSLEKVLNVAERISGLRRAGGERNGWEIGLDYVKELAVPALQTFQNFWSLRNGGRPMPPVGGQPGAAPNGSIDPYANPQALRELANTMRNQAGAVPPQSAPPPPQPPGELAAIVQNFGGLVINHLNVGTPGQEVADSLVALMGNATHAQICAQGEPALVQALMSAPEIAMFGEPRIRAFVHEFVNFREILDAEQNEEDDSEPAPARFDRSEQPAAKGATR